MKTALAILCIIYTSLVFSQAQYQYEYEPKGFEEGRQYKEYIDGKLYCMSSGNASDIAMRLVREEKWVAFFEVAIRYAGERTHFLPEESLKVTGVDKNYQTVEYKVYSHEEYMKLVKKRQGSQYFFVALGEALSNMDAGKSSSVSRKTSYSQSSGYSSETTTTNTYDHTKARLVDQASEDKLNDLSANQAYQRMSINNTLLKPSTIYNGDYLYGNIYLQIPREDKGSHAVHVELQVGEDLHTIYFVSTN